MEALKSEKIALNVSEAAALLGISRPTMYQLLKRPGFPAFKVGTRTLIPREGFLRWLNAQPKGAEK